MSIKILYLRWCFFNYSDAVQLKEESFAMKFIDFSNSVFLGTWLRVYGKVTSTFQKSFDIPPENGTPQNQAFEEDLPFPKGWFSDNILSHEGCKPLLIWWLYFADSKALITSNSFPALLWGDGPDTEIISSLENLKSMLRAMLQKQSLSLGQHFTLILFIFLHK